MRVLVIAEAANPEWASVPLIGWSLAQALRTRCEAHLVTQVRNRPAILRAGWVEGRDFSVIDNEFLERPLWRLATWLRGGNGVGWTIQTAIHSLSYPMFERMIWKRFGSDLRAGRFDVVHRITPVSPTSPSTLARRCKSIGVPFVLGPINGGVPWPPGFGEAQRKEKEWLSSIRGVYKLRPSVQATYRSAAAILCGSGFTQGDLPPGHADRAFYLPENAIDPARFNRRAVPYDGGVLKLSFVGRLVPYKGPDLLLEAVAPLLKTGRVTLDVIGDGPVMPELRRLATAHGLGEDVLRLHGWLAHAQVQEVLAASHVMAFPSIREFGGGVVLEAMALGVVPMVVDYAGPGELVSDATGYRIPLSDRTGLVEAFRSKIAALIGQPEPLRTQSQAAFHHVLQHLTWDAKAHQLQAVYRWVQQSGAPRPVLPFSLQH